MNKLALSMFSPFLAFVLCEIVIAGFAGCDQQLPKPVSVPVGKGSEATGFVLFETIDVKNGTAAEIQAAEETWQRAHPEYRIRVIVPVIGGGGVKSLVITAYREAPTPDVAAK